jgi:4-amino-4-deoxy-L-arabinose transferase-like glycosyltransferase
VTSDVEFPQSQKPSAWTTRRRRLALPFAIAILGLAMNTIVALSMSQTMDEEGHLAYGFRIMHGAPDRSQQIFDSKMPVTLFNALPRAASAILRDSGTAPGLAEMLHDVRAARLVSVAAAFGLCLLVFVCAESLYGRVGGLFAQLLVILSPNLIAHSTLVTTDLYAALSALLFLYCLRRYLLAPGTRRAALTASALALAQLTKFVAAYLYLALAVVLIVVVLCSRFGRHKTSAISGRQIVILLGLNVVTLAAFLNVGFVFDRTFTPMSEYQFRSATFRGIQQVPLLRDIPVPLPYAYLQGLDWMSEENAEGLGFGNISLLGEARGRDFGRVDGFPSYYLVAYALKEPLGMQVLLILSLVWIVRHRKPGDFLTGELPLVATACVILLMLSFFSNAQIGIRHILPVLAIFMVLSGAAFAQWREFSWRRRGLLAGCLLWTAVSMGSYFPSMIPYFNETIGDRKLAYRFLADSNLDWNQDSAVVDRFLHNNPDVQVEPLEPSVGRILVSGDTLAGVIPQKAHYWLRQLPVKPIAQVGYAHFLFSLPIPP